MARPEAVLFDLDDTLVRPPGDAPERLRRAFEAVGVEPLFDRAAVERGVSRVEGESPLDLRVKAFRAAARETGGSPEAAERVARAYEPAPPEAHEPVPGAAGVVQTLGERGFDLGLVTNGAESEQRPKLRRAGLADAFDAEFFATPERGIKPDPAPFRTAASDLGYAPADCVYVGDAYETDIEPAADLGVTTVWVPTGEGERPAPAADAVLSAIDDLPALSWASR